MSPNVHVCTGNTEASSSSKISPRAHWEGMQVTQITGDRELAVPEQANSSNFRNLWLPDSFPLLNWKCTSLIGFCSNIFSKEKFFKIFRAIYDLPSFQIIKCPCFFHVLHVQYFQMTHQYTSVILFYILSNLCMWLLKCNTPNKTQIVWKTDM